MKLLHCAFFFCCIYYLQAVKYEDFSGGVLPSIDDCGRQYIDDNSIIEADAEVEEFPWMVYVPLEQRQPIHPDPKFRCSGSLISKRHFITSLYCLEYFIRNVYIGQHDTSKNETCGAFGCKPVQKVEVESWFADYEIALIRLAEDVEFSEYVQPICLPFEDFPKAEIGDTVYSSGWGQIFSREEYSETKKKIKQALVDNEKCECEESSVKIPKEAKLMCTKVNLEESANVPCFGDGGAPIVYRTSQNQWVLLGILPYLPECVTEESGRGAAIDDEVLKFIKKYMHD